MCILINRKMYKLLSDLRSMLCISKTPWCTITQMAGFFSRFTFLALVWIGRNVLNLTCFHSSGIIFWLNISFVSLPKWKSYQLYPLAWHWLQRVNNRYFLHPGQLVKPVVAFKLFCIHPVGLAVYQRILLYCAK